MRPHTTQEQKDEIIYRFFNSKDNRVKSISEAMNLDFTTVNNAINDYFKNKVKHETYFITIESRLNFMTD